MEEMCGNCVSPPHQNSDNFFQAADSRKESSIFILHLEPSIDSDFRLFLHRTAEQVSTAVGADGTHQYQPHCSLTGYFQIFHESTRPRHQLKVVSPIINPDLEESGCCDDAGRDVSHAVCKTLINSLLAPDFSSMIGKANNEEPFFKFPRSLNSNWEDDELSDMSCTRSTRASSSATTSSSSWNMKDPLSDDDSLSRSPLSDASVKNLSAFCALEEKAEPESSLRMPRSSPSEVNTSDVDKYLWFGSPANSASWRFECVSPHFPVTVFRHGSNDVSQELTAQKPKNDQNLLSVLTTQSGHVLIPLQCSGIRSRLHHMIHCLEMYFGDRLERYNNIADLRRSRTMSEYSVSPQNSPGGEPSIVSLSQLHDEVLAAKKSELGCQSLTRLDRRPHSGPAICLKNARHVSLAEGRLDDMTKQRIAQMYRDQAPDLNSSIANTPWDIVLYQLHPQKRSKMAERLPLSEVFRIHGVCHTEIEAI